MIIKRIETIIEKKESEIFCLSHSILVCLPTICIPICSHLKRRAKKREIEELKFVKSIAIFRRDAAGPSAEMSLPAELQRDLKEKTGKSTFDDSYYFYANGNAAACGTMHFGVGYRCVK